MTRRGPLQTTRCDWCGTVHERERVVCPYCGRPDPDCDPGDSFPDRNDPEGEDVEEEDLED